MCLEEDEKKTKNKDMNGLLEFPNRAEASVEFLLTWKIYMLKMPITILINSTRTLHPYREQKHKPKVDAESRGKTIMKFQTKAQQKQQAATKMVEKGEKERKSYKGSLGTRETKQSKTI